MIPVGVFLDCLSVLIGGTVGASFQKRIPHRIKDPLVIVFGVSAVAIGINSFTRVHSLPAVILSLILGVLIGELIDLDSKVRRIFERVINRFHFKIEGDREEYMRLYLVVAATFCASGTNIFGALNEGMSGDKTVLLSKAAMDIFASMIFASELGFAMHLIVIPQCLILSVCFYLSWLIMPFATPEMLADFVAVGGLMTFALGLCIAKIIRISAINFLPALVVAFPISWLSSRFPI